MGCGISQEASLISMKSYGQGDGQMVISSPPPPKRTADTQTPPNNTKSVENKSSNAKTPGTATPGKVKENNPAKEVTDAMNEVSKEETTPIGQLKKVTEWQTTPEAAKAETNEMKEVAKGQTTSSKQDNGSQDQGKTTPTGEPKGNTKSSTEKSVKKSESKDKNESYLPLEPESQRKFDTVLGSACLLVKSDSVMKTVDRTVTRLKLHQALPHTYSLSKLVTGLQNLQVLDLSNNNLGPQGFRSVCLAMCSNTSVVSLNLAGNKSDTDSAECVGRMLSQNRSLVYLDVSFNNLGKDYFSRCVGPALKTNNVLQTLRAQSIGSTDMKVLLECLPDNTTLTEVDLSSNSLTDRACLGTAFALWIKSSHCELTSLSLSSCDMNPESLSVLGASLSENSTLNELNLNGNEFGSLNLILKFIVYSCCHGNIRNLHMNDAKVKDQSVSEPDSDFPETTPCLQVLSLHSSNISNSLFSMLKKWCKGRQLLLTDLDTTNNSSLTTDCIDDIISITKDESETSSLQRLMFGMNDAGTLSDKIDMSCLPSLTYLNLRKAKMTATGVTALLEVCLCPNSQLTTLVLDGLKLAGTDAMKDLAKIQGSRITTLSLGGCSLADSDLSPLCDLIKQGHPLHMLKLSANRITDAGVEAMVQAVLSQSTHPLSVLDLSNNTIGDTGAISLSQLYVNKKHKSSLHSLNVSGNNIGKAGVISLVTVIGNKSHLRTLYLNNQRNAIAEVDMDEVYSKLASSLGFKVPKSGEEIQASSSDLPSLQDGLLINLSKLGGQPGNLGRMLHSRTIITDMSQDILTGLTLSGVLEIVAGLQRLGPECILSSEDWNLITGANKDREVPSWLQLADHRERAVYLCNLPGNTTVQKLEGMLEMEADCSVDEVVLMKDPVTRSNNGVGWVLLSDSDSVKKAIDFYLQGEAKVFGQPFSISRILVKVDDEKNSELEAKARQDIEERTKVRRSEDAAHRALIQQNTEESWKRHAYRLAHPAYADGRIW